MRFMMMMIPGVYQGTKGKTASAEHVPSAAQVEQMMKYNEALAKSGSLISLDGLHSPATGARVSYAGGKPKVTDGPFTEAKEVLGGYWIIDVKSREEAISWAKRVPAEADDVVEVRQIFEMTDFPADVQKAAENPIVEAAVEKRRK